MVIPIEDDEAAIRRVLDEVHAAVWTKDFERFARHHVQADYARRWAWWLPDTLVIKEGWEAIGERLARIMADPMMPDGVSTRVERENFNLRVEGNMAWVTFDQVSPTPPNWSVGIAGISREMRVLEKHDGEWKVAFVAMVNRSRPLPDAPRFRIDTSARLLWHNDAAAIELAEGRSLVVRAGRLQARERSANRELQSAIRWAAGLESGFEIRHGALPILPDPAHDETAKIWWVTFDAGIIQLSVNDRRLPDEKLALAAAVYGLSAAQARLAKMIVAGQPLPVAATDAGISLNTARTHLRRLFEKTGVRNQAALVRALLTVTVPD
jgi:DNA-binding CsgD family transcriptional regulator